MGIRSIYVIGIIVLIVFAIIFCLVFFKSSTFQENISTVRENIFISYASELNLNIPQFKSCLDSRKYISDILSDRNEGNRNVIQGIPTYFVNDKTVYGARYSLLNSTIDIALNDNSTNTIKLGSLPPEGNLSARVVVVEFMDYTCDSCVLANLNDKTLLSERGNEIKFIVMSYPRMNEYDLALDSALAARCANEQVKFWEYNDILLNRMSEWNITQ